MVRQCANQEHRERIRPNTMNQRPRIIQRQRTQPQQPQRPRRPRRTGRPSQVANHQRIRKEHSKKPFRRQSSYLNSLLICLWFIYKRIFSQQNDDLKEKKTQVTNLALNITQFVGDKRKFLQLLEIMTRDRFPTIEQSIAMDNTTQLLVQPLPRTFIAGLVYIRQEKLKTTQNRSKPSETVIQLTISQIKILYFITIFITGVSSRKIYSHCHIDFFNFNQTDAQTINNRFDIIIRQLINETKLLNTEVFQKLESNWDLIAGHLQWEFQGNQLLREPAIEQAVQEIYRNEEVQPPVDQERIQANDRWQQNVQEILNHEIIILPNNNMQVNEEQNLIQIEGYHPVLFVQDQNQEEGSNRSYDVEEILNFEEELGDQTFRITEQNQQKVQKKAQIIQQDPQQVYMEEIEEKEDYKTKMIKKASKTLNYGKVTTYSKAHKDLMLLKSFNNMSTKEEQFKQNEIQASEIYQQNSLGQIRPQPPILTQEQITLAFDDNPRQQEIVFQEEILSQGIELELPNPNRLVTHQSRQIDTLVNLIVQDQDIIAKTIISYIYFACQAQNIRIIF